MEQWPHICVALSWSNVFPTTAVFPVHYFETRHTSYTAILATATPLQMVPMPIHLPPSFPGTLSEAEED